MSIAIATTANAELITAGPLRLRILEDGHTTGHRLGVAELTIPAHVAGPPQHIHHKHDETFYVITGSPSFTCGISTVIAEPGTLVTAPPGTPHTFANPGDTTAVVLCTFTPDLYIDYFRELSRLPAGPTGIDPKLIGEVMSRYATEIVPPTSAWVDI